MKSKNKWSKPTAISQKSLDELKEKFSVSGSEIQEFERWHKHRKSSFTRNFCTFWRLYNTHYKVNEWLNLDGFNNKYMKGYEEEGGRIQISPWLHSEEIFKICLELIRQSKSKIKADFALIGNSTVVKCGEVVTNGETCSHA